MPRPKKLPEAPPEEEPDGDGATQHLRVHADIKDMAKWICKATGQTAAALVDPILRPELEAMYEQNRALIEQLKANAKRKKGG